uniref:Uncharacterized protein n=1 Tax=Kalanchoe fedtschenkoi TaxID=63787 RepID=A0A7N0TZ71_KALFE
MRFGRPNRPLLTVHGQSPPHKRVSPPKLFAARPSCHPGGGLQVEEVWRRPSRSADGLPNAVATASSSGGNFNFSGSTSPHGAEVTGIVLVEAKRQRKVEPVAEGSSGCLDGLEAPPSHGVVDLIAASVVAAPPPWLGFPRPASPYLPCWRRTMSQCRQL